MRRGVAGCALVAILAGAGAARAAEVETLRQSGPANLRFNIAVLGDGYRAQDQAKLKTDAQAIVDYVFGVTPLKQYQSLFNVKLVHVISKEDGADNGSNGVTRDTALDARFDCDQIDRLLCVDDGKVQVAALTDVPEYNFALVLVNDSKYGGSGGTVCVSSSNKDSFEVVAHEIGHSLAHLADEYSYQANYPACDQQKDCLEANATLRTTREQVKWQDWIDGATPVPTPASSQFADAVGLFEGARYTPLGVYRPQQNCKMRDLGADYCSVCTEQFVRSIWTAENIEMIETATPPELAVQSDSCDPIALSVTNPPIMPSTYKYVWSVDGNAQLETTNAIRLLPGALMPGAHQVEVRVVDATAMVRTDTKGVLTDQHTWTVTASKSDCPTPSAGGGGGVGGGAGVSFGGSGAGGANGAGADAGVGGLTGGVNERPAPPPRETPGCGCAVPGRPTSPGFLAWLALAVGSRRRRRARR